MKKLIIYLSIFLFVKQASAQQYYLKPVTIDSLVSVSLPKEYTKKDTLGEQIYSAKGTYGAMLVLRSINPSNAKTIKNEKGLDNVFNEYIKKIQSSVTHGTVLNDHDTTITNLQARDFTLQVDSGAGAQSRHFTLIYTKNVTYTFQYLYEDFRMDLAKGEMKAFLKSIKVSPQLTSANQFIKVPGSPVIVKILLFGGIPLIVIIAFVVIRRRRLKPSIG